MICVNGSSVSPVFHICSAGQFLSYPVCDTRTCPSEPPGYGGVHWPIRGHICEYQAIINLLSNMY